MLGGGGVNTAAVQLCRRSKTLHREAGCPYDTEPYWCSLPGIQYEVASRRWKTGGHLSPAVLGRLRAISTVLMMAQVVLTFYVTKFAYNWYFS
jgi:hypothetical protein